jgi:hypothetical protein
VATCSFYDLLLQIWTPESCIFKRLWCSFKYFSLLNSE